MLAHLRQLRELTLNDPTTTPNPVCLMHNYATHVLYHMPHLQQLDTHDISSAEVKETAEVRTRSSFPVHNDFFQNSPEFAENDIYFSLVLISLLVHRNEENDVLQHACADCSEEAERNTSLFDGKKENHVRGA